MIGFLYTQAPIKNFTITSYTYAVLLKIDEATASVDASTEALIQQVVRSEFKESTCFTIAHRINTIMDSDFILLMNEGVIEEYGTPSALMEKRGMFYSFIRAWEE